MLQVTPMRVRTIQAPKFRSCQEGSVDSLVVKSAEFSSKQIPDPFSETYLGSDSANGYLNAVAPPYPPSALAKVPIQNNMILQCISAMVINCELTGHQLVYIGPKEKKESEEVLNDKSRVENMLAMPDGENTIRDLRKKYRTDFETFGYWFMEIGRDVDKNIAWFTHVPADTMRICAMDPEMVPVKRNIRRGTGKWEAIAGEKQFRRYVQLVGSRKRYFKEYGDPRVISAKTGMVQQEGEAAIEEEDIATEILHHRIYTPTDLYGKPRWINNLLAAVGSREAEMANFRFFQDNTIPAMAILVAGGELTAETLEELDSKFSESGQDSLNRVVIIEAKGNPDDAGGVDSATPIPSLEMRPLNGDRQSDAMFVEYDNTNQAKVRSSFRMPPIFVGRSEDYTRATAEASLEMGENQLFGPERQDFDDILNFKILLKDGKPSEFWSVRSNTSKLTNSDGVITALTALNEMGAVSTNSAIQRFNELFGMNMPTIPDAWADMPFAIVKFMMEQQTLQLSEEHASALKSLQGLVAKGGGKEPAPSPIKQVALPRVVGKVRA